PATSPSAWRGMSECPLLGNDTNWRHPIFRNVRTVATNRPSHLVGSRKGLLPTLARFPRDVYWEGNPALTRTWELAAGGPIETGNEIIAAVDAADPFNQFLNERIPQPIMLRALLLLGSLALLVFTVMRLLRARQRIAATEPLLALCLAEQAPGRPLLARRHE